MLKNTDLTGFKFTNISHSCEVLATYNSEPILVKNKIHLVASFHPEVGDDSSIFKYFLNSINE